MRQEIVFDKPPSGARALHPARKLQGADGPKDRTLDKRSRDHIGLVDVLNHDNAQFTRDPRITVRVLEVHGSVVYGFGHVLKIDVEHRGRG